ncbi:DNA-packaging protein [Albimonas donghaensis]|uniref:DNA-packaging protein n=1 Tax=Albimonas donghaensis TaxID=356660 RepID=UPI001FDF466F|nr:terminase family protein [Albimonas donghaensis]
MPGHQVAPPGDWRTWVVLGGRGAGKTRAGTEWVRARVEGGTPLGKGACRRIALVGETIDQAREVMVEGPSGLRACSPPDRRPVYEVTRKRLVWENGAEARLFSAHDPEGLRGPQFDGAWSDELAKWPKGRAAWDMLQFALRLGDRPRQLVTTTPRRNPLLKEILAAPDTVMTSAPTSANAANLASEFLDAVNRRYAGSALGRQELEGELLDDVEGALWNRALIDGGRVAVAPEMSRIVVAVDPPATSGPDADACGIVVAGLGGDGVVYVLADLTLQGAAPSAWAARAVKALEEFQADRIVAEVNQGGELVETLIRQVDPRTPYKAVRATRGKVTRAEPVAALYEQGRVRHAGSFPLLEDQMCAWTGETGQGSPDRMDALVWAVTELSLGAGSSPRVRRL